MEVAAGSEAVSVIKKTVKRMSAPGEMELDL